MTVVLAEHVKLMTRRLVSGGKKSHSVLLSLLSQNIFLEIFGKSLTFFKMGPRLERKFS
jgi:hypothetical protein